MIDIASACVGVLIVCDIAHRQAGRGVSRSGASCMGRVPASGAYGACVYGSACTELHHDGGGSGLVQHGHVCGVCMWMRGRTRCAMHAPAHVCACTHLARRRDRLCISTHLDQVITAWTTRESAAQSRLPIAFREVRLRCYLRLACDWRNHQTNRSQ